MSFPIGFAEAWSTPHIGLQVSFLGEKQNELKRRHTAEVFGDKATVVHRGRKLTDATSTQTGHGCCWETFYIVAYCGLA